ncbi:MAG: hypothetical protein ACPGXK_13330, partial [Phycisphaerae bacterium]
SHASSDAAASDAATVAGQGDTCTTAAFCQAGNNDDADASDRVGFVVADGFTPAVDGDISEICWLGAYDDGANDCQGFAPDTFEIRYYANAAGFPGALIAEFTQQSGNLTVTGPTATGNFVAGFAPEYTYSATHAPVSVLSNGCYWVEITNVVNSNNCVWFWERGLGGDNRGMQDGQGPDGYNAPDASVLDHAFCVNVPISPTMACYPNPPANDDCANSITLDDGFNYFDTTRATTDGPAEPGCGFVQGEDQVNQDVWFDYTATCTDNLTISLCSSTYDTKMTVYSGSSCPTVESAIACGDDDDVCAPDGLQSRITLPVNQGEQYKIRVGGFSTTIQPGLDVGPGTINIQCGSSCGPGAGGCFEANGTPGCDDPNCCEIVCAEDAFCCDTEWDTLCANSATATCLGNEEVCLNAGGNCCESQVTPGCGDLSCCLTVCGCDGFCCEVEWDENCAGMGLNGNGCGAGALCEAICSDCPDGDVTWFNPQSGIFDAGMPTSTSNELVVLGFEELQVVPPQGIQSLDCWSVCETVQNESLHQIGTGFNFISQQEQQGGLLNLVLAHDLTAGEVTRVTYTSSTSNTITTATFVVHPGDVNADGTSDSADIRSLIEALNGAEFPLTQVDVSRNSQLGPEDILRLIDVLNGGGAFQPWYGVTVDPLALCP